jgi:arylsulfatase A-like enzyme
MFLIDDMGFNDIPWNNPDIDMPFVSSLAADGKILTHAYTSHVCSPSRGAFLSGFYPHHTGMAHSVYGESNPECTPFKFDLLPKKLKEAGYKSHMIGKWHLGFCNIECTPTGRGFDTFYGFYHGAVDHWTRVTSAGSPGYDWHDEVAGDLSSYGADLSAANAPEDGIYSQDLLTQRTIDLIHAHDQSHPLFMYLPSPLVHTPMQARQHLIDEVPESKGSLTRRTFIAMCKELDISIQKTVDAIKEAGMYDNSLIIFYSDNGGEANYGSNIPLRGCKASLWEGGIRVPAMIHSPLMDESVKGTKDDGMFYIADLHSTILDLAGLDSSGTDGTVQTDFLFRGGETSRNEFIPSIDVMFPQLFGQGAIRIGDYKLFSGWPGLYDGWEGNNTLGIVSDLDLLGLNDPNHPEHGDKHHGAPAKRGDYDFDEESMFGYLGMMGSVYQLYNIKEDPYEEHNIVNDFPEIAKEMQTRFYMEAAIAWQIHPDSLNPVEAGMPEHNDGNWVTGFCPDGPIN